MTRHFVSAALLWIALTAAGETALLANLFPTVGSREAEDFDRIFKILLGMGIPVFAFVIAVLTYAFIEFRGTGAPGEAGPSWRGHGMVPKVWLAVTGGLAVLVMIYPGLTGLAKLQSSGTGYGWGATQGQLVVDVQGFRWQWQFTYEGSNVVVAPGGNKALVLPVDEDIRFNVTSSDVIHSFWIPAFRMKIDAVPGRTTFMTVHPTELGEYANDSAFRVECAELCGLDHAAMFFPVRVVSQDEFNAWLKSQQQPQGGK